MWYSQINSTIIPSYPFLNGRCVCASRQMGWLSAQTPGNARHRQQHIEGTRAGKRSSALMQSDWVILMKLSSNLPGREIDGGGGEKEAFSLLSLLSSVDLWPSDRKEQMNGKTWTFREPDGSGKSRLQVTSLRFCLFNPLQSWRT